MTEWEKAQKGYLYDANYDKEIVEARTRCADLCYEFNNLRPSDTEKQQELLKKILGKMEGMPVVTAPFYCDYGINISVGRNFYTNHLSLIHISGGADRSVFAGGRKSILLLHRWDRCKD